MREVKIAAVSVIGRGHLKKNTVCQDSHYKYQKNGVNVLAISDGAGSKSYSHIGSKLLVNKVCQYLSENFKKIYTGDYSNVRKDLMNYLLKELEKKKYSLKIQRIEEFAATLLFVAQKEDKFLVGHIGDGVIGYLKNEELRVVSKPENGEYANETYFVHPNFLEKLRLGKGTLEGVEGFILMTDGGESGLYHRAKNELIESNKEIIKWLEKRKEFRVEKALRKNIKEKFRKITRDDVTIGVIYIKEKKRVIYKRKGVKKREYKKRYGIGTKELRKII